MAKTAGSKIGILGILLSLVIIFAIIIGNVYVYLIFRSNPNLFFGLVDNATNFPWGLLTAIFAPDATVLNGSQTFADWYIGFAVAMVIFFMVFLITNLGANDREIGFRSILYGSMLIVISIASNAFSLVRGQSSTGPSTATFASMGLVLGFSILNSGIWLERGHPKFQGGREHVSIIASLAIVFGLIFLALVSPATFFNIDPAHKVDWVAHLFCFVIGAVVPFWYYTTKEASEQHSPQQEPRKLNMPEPKDALDREGLQIYESEAITKRLLLHGALWIALATTLDVVTSWIMMTLRGVASEGNATMRLLFENRDLSTLLTWVSQQYVYLDLAAAAILLYFLARTEGHIAPRWLRMTVFRTAYRVVILMTWFFAGLRLYYGPPGNTISILLSYGEVIALVGASALFVFVLWVMLSDMRIRLILHRVLHGVG